jgi:hypothetical protein
MKNKVEKFPIEHRVYMSLDKSCPADWEQASLRQAYAECLKDVELNKKFIAWEMACEWQEAKMKLNEERATQKSGDCPGGLSAQEKEAARRRRTDQILELGKSFNPHFAPDVEKDGPDLERD